MKNMITRTISGILFMGVMVGCLLWNKWSFLGLMLVILIMMMFEFYRMTMGKRYKFSQMLSILAAVILFVLTFFTKSSPLENKYILLAFIPLFVVMINSLYVKDKSEFGKFSNIYTGMLYIAIPLVLTNFAVFNHAFEYTGLILLSFFGIIWTSDVGAYIFGISLGQKFGRKLFPEISPKKSWVGFWGGLISAVAVSLGLWYLDLKTNYLVGFELKWYYWVVLGVVMNVAGVYGDLIESQWKRYYEIKDSGKSIPGHGGFLDRFDSALLAIPVGIIVLELLNVLTIPE